MVRKKSPDAIEPIPLMLRLPPDIHEWIKQLAQFETRSLNSQVIAILRDAKKRQQQDATTKPPQGD